ncbi:MAG: S8 family serine peptidase [Saprospiraceae bacterium]|nr:S8 family serine peptidase [Saprospiraceae bacterium]
MLIIVLFLTSFVALSFWFLFKESSEMRSVFGKLFLLFLSLYLGASFLMAVDIFSWVTIILNFAFLFFGGFFLNTFSKSKIIFIPLLFLITIGYYFVVTEIRWPLVFYNQEETISNQLINIPDKLDPDNELLLELSKGHDLIELRSIINKYNLLLEPAFRVHSKNITDLDDYFVVNIPEKQLVNYHEILEAFKNSGFVDHIEANEILSLDPTELVTSSNIETRGKYSVNDPDIDKVWGFDIMHVQDLYDLLSNHNVQPKKKARIAIIDTGVDAMHEDIKDNFVSIGIVHDDDIHGHGTHCAGIAAAVSNNAKGIASFAPDLKYIEIFSVKVFGKYGNTTQRKIIEGMLLAVDNNADVLSMSLGGVATAKSQRAYKQAVNYANKKGAIVVVAAGNENVDARKRVPACVDGVITVAAINENLEKAIFSNDVSNLKMGIAAPGVEIYSTIPDNNYQYFNGTSMATPYVAGLIGLMKSIQPNLDTDSVYNMLKNTGDITLSANKTGNLINPVGAIKDLLNK